MSRSILSFLGISGLAYFIVLALFDQRLADGALNIDEMQVWEFPILLTLLVAVFGLWYRGVASAYKGGSNTTFWLALLIWPFGIYCAFK
ncbi:MAG: hypothetical protein HRT54_21675 [Colwellia sp.]|nr:hypothetical protein [Colwellia sp.]